MLYVENHRELIATVSRAIGESQRRVRTRGFQLIEIVVFNGDESLPEDGDPSMTTDADDNDAIDLATVAGLPEQADDGHRDNDGGD